MNAIGSISAYQQAAQSAGVTTQAAQTTVTVGGTVDFSNSLTRAIHDVEAQHVEADSALERLASGDDVDLHGTMIELEKADIALRTMVSVRDRFISAYEQVMNMSV